MSDVESDDELNDEPDAAPARSRRTVSLSSVVLGVLVLAAIAFAVVQTQRRADLADDVDLRAEASDVAARFAERLLTYDFADLDAQADELAQLSTPDFSDEYEDALAGGLGASISELEATATATVDEVMTSVVSQGRARVVVIVDSEIESQAGTRANIGTYLDIELLRLDGTWRVDDVQTVSNLTESSTPTPTPTPDAADPETPETEDPEAPAPEDPETPETSSTTAG